MRTNFLRSAYYAGRQFIAADPSAADAPAESFDAIRKVEQHRWYWRPDQPGLILIAESHVYTSDADIGVSIDHQQVGPLFHGQPLPPPEYVGLVYCLGYGEKNLVLNPHAELSNRRTWLFWDLLGKVSGRDKQPRVSAKISMQARLEWKVGTLTSLKELGVWLLDASAHAIYVSNGLRRSPACCKALHRQWWEHYGRGVVAECGDPFVWVIGSSVHKHLEGSDGFKCRGFVYQPNARGKIDREHNWDRLLADVATLRKRGRTRYH